ncbi:MAG: tetratricopeptide repeat protein, partial [Bacteroides sp.]
HEGALLLKGSIEEKKGLSNEAYETYTKLINLNPFCSKAYSQLAKYYIHQHLLDQALDVLNEAIELNPNDANLYQHRGSVKLIMNDKDGAFDDTKKALELDPTIKESISGEFRS